MMIFFIGPFHPEEVLSDAGLDGGGVVSLGAPCGPDPPAREIEKHEATALNHLHDVRYRLNSE
jgi:hypothetical protein